MVSRLLTFTLLLAGAAGLAGCGPAKLDVTKNYTVGGETPAQGFELDPQPKPQTLTIEFSSSASEVEVVVFKKSDAADIDAVSSASSSKAIASKKGKSETFTAEIPENTGAWVAVRTLGPKSDVTVKVTNRK